MSTPNTTALAVVPDMPEWAKRAVEPYTAPGAYNLLLPAIPLNGTLGFGQQISVAKVSVNPDPKSGEVYKVGSRFVGGQEKFEDVVAMAKPALMRIASAAGIQFKTSRVDDRSNRNAVEYECVSAVKNSSGAVVVQAYRKAIDLRDVHDASLAKRIADNKKAEPNKRKTDEQIEADVEAEMVQFRLHMAARCETGAILRAVRGQLGIKSQWSKAELAKPFILLRVDFQPDASDPDVKRFLLEQGQRSAAQLFAGGMPIASHPEAVVVDDSPAEPEFTSDQPDAATVVVTVEKPVDLDAAVAEAARALEIGFGDLQNLYRKHGNDAKLVLAELNAMANTNERSEP